MNEFGAHLQQARESAGMTLEDIHGQTRISIKNLRLLEAGDFPSIPQTYVRAFVREYARVVGLDENETLTLYNQMAEQEKGIPAPPDNIDSSNLQIRVDDTIEYIEPLDRPTTHVEVDGIAEVETEDYVPPVRRSRFVPEDSLPPIDIRTSAAKEEALSPPTRKTTSSSDSASEESVDAAPEAQGRATDSSKSAALASEKKTPSAEKPDPEKKTPPAAKPASAEKPALAKNVPPAEKPALAKNAPPTEKPASVKKVSPTEKPAPAKKAPPTEKPAPAKKAPPTEKPVSERKAAPAEKSAASPSPRPQGSDSSNERRIIGVGLVIITIIVIAAYGLFYFSGDSEGDTAQVDSTAIKASIEAGRFIDSSHYAMTDIDQALQDTVPTEPLTPPEPVESKPRVFERSDSLVLEAFTNAPVWFSVKMDTLRSERGSLSSNEHRVWKAREFFVITLGDAGAVTFFLNGKEIGTLGDEGAVVKNVTLSRRQLQGN